MNLYENTIIQWVRDIRVRIDVKMNKRSSDVLGDAEQDMVKVVS